MNPPQQDQSAIIKEALLQIRELRAKLAQAERPDAEPIAVVGLSCRFPGGANTPAKYWQRLQSGTNLIAPVPAERQALGLHYGTMPDGTAIRGGFMDDIAAFDAQFFGISPREARYLDPQQRLLLEVGWEALETANIVPGALFNSSTGVFIGLDGTDFEG
ncbi:MAG: short-chain dehydrogenase, partial [Okeania sp. SIO3B3]|nr:short-chain dehydrogenase [Okeania sp. SIO3B3]